MPVNSLSTSVLTFRGFIGIYIIANPVRLVNYLCHNISQFSPEIITLDSLNQHKYYSFIKRAAFFLSSFVFVAQTNVLLKKRSYTQKSPALGRAFLRVCGKNYLSTIYLWVLSGRSSFSQDAAKVISTLNSSQRRRSLSVIFAKAS